MILTVTTNPSLDRVLIIEELILGSPVRAEKEVVCVGGKGLDVSVAARCLGLPSVALSFMAGQTGKLLEDIIVSYGVIPETVWVEGETRVSYVIAETRQKRVSHIKVGRILVCPEHVKMLLAGYQRSIKEADWVVIGGSIPESAPADLYAGLIDLARQAGLPVLVDSYDTPVWKLMRHMPDILKMNWDEFNITFNCSTRSLTDLFAAAENVIAENALNALLVTCGVHGMVAVKEETAYHVRVPPQEAVNAAGAGDAASAGLVWRLSMGECWEEALKWSAAVSAAAVLTEATGEVKREQAESIYPQVEVVSIRSA
jgi:1-phosphofructokinase family hexose kinase